MPTVEEYSGSMIRRSTGKSGPMSIHTKPMNHLSGSDSDDLNYYFYNICSIFEDSCIKNP
jgi:hypothetical protein